LRRQEHVSSPYRVFFKPFGPEGRDLAMKVDESQAVVEGWRLSERAIEWYALTGGGPGILAGAFVFRHKTRHGALLAKVAVVTVLTWLILLSAIRL
jgi:uncharacterized membrane protein YsdA (DUF1294 family)